MSAQSAQNLITSQKFPSMTSVHSMVSMGYIPPGHGYIPKPLKPEKPYGPTFVSVMNRTWRGPGRKYLNYALTSFCVCILFVCASGLYLGHRNVFRMVVLRTEVFGAIFTIIAICTWCLTFYYINRAREESNRWRYFVKFRPEGMFTIAAYNQEYCPEDGKKLLTGTYGARALTEIPKPRRKGGRSRAGSQSSLRPVPEGPPEPRGGAPPQGPPMAGPEAVRAPPQARLYDKRGGRPQQPYNDKHPLTVGLPDKSSSEGEMGYVGPAGRPSTSASREDLGPASPQDVDPMMGPRLGPPSPLDPQTHYQMAPMGVPVYARVQRDRQPPERERGPQAGRVIKLEGAPTAGLNESEL